MSDRKESVELSLAEQLNKYLNPSHVPLSFSPHPQGVRDLEEVAMIIDKYTQPGPGFLDVSGADERTQKIVGLRHFLKTARIQNFIKHGIFSLTQVLEEPQQKEGSTLPNEWSGILTSEVRSLKSQESIVLVCYLVQSGVQIEYLKDLDGKRLNEIYNMLITADTLQLSIDVVKHFKSDELSDFVRLGTTHATTQDEANTIIHRRKELESKFKPPLILSAPRESSTSAHLSSDPMDTTRDNESLKRELPKKPGSPKSA
jgi:DNA-binding protein Fis